MQESNTEMKGIIFDIQKFSVHDGPGIRTTVFLKGCPLRCSWCANPESQDYSFTLMVREVNCKSCGACVKVCPQSAIFFTDAGVRKIDWNKCDSCLVCVESCIYHSLNRCGWHVSVEEVLEEVIQDKPFYENSGGGVTISGGEPLSQPIFLLDLLTECNKNGLHTAIETTGHAPWMVIEKILPHVDLILFDIKHMDPEKHQDTTGVKNNLILENLKKIAKIHDNIWLRVPLISGFNDSEDHIRKVATLGKEIGAKKISLLPYHEGGKNKCEQIGKSYLFSSNVAPDENKIARLKTIIKEIGLEVSIGN